MEQRLTKTVVLLHGLWVTVDSWEAFRRPWEAAGWAVITPTWPMLRGRTAADINTDPPAELGGVSVTDVVASLQEQIERLPEPPLLLGHSFGGLFAQILLDRGVGYAGIAVNPAPIGGIVHGWLTLTAALPPILRLNGWNRPYAFSRSRWANRFANAAQKSCRIKHSTPMSFPPPEGSSTRPHPGVARGSRRSAAPSRC
ncbi:MAG: alpha/beta fold hydrolase [Caulobacterales bacterium]|nr:alpha/beta fold hydrolase [Caulobacterales bacterium]